jgi:hypothetical protein
MELPSFNVQEGISNEQLVFRAFLRPNWFEVHGTETKATPVAFLRRRDRDPDGLSVGPTAEACQAYLSIKMGFCKLVAGEIRRAGETREGGVSYGMDVVPDRIDHANIINVPHRHENPELALAIASDLAKIANEH